MHRYNHRSMPLPLAHTASVPIRDCCCRCTGSALRCGRGDEMGCSQVAAGPGPHRSTLCDPCTETPSGRNGGGRNDQRSGDSGPRPWRDVPSLRGRRNTMAELRKTLRRLPAHEGLGRIDFDPTDALPSHFPTCSGNDLNRPSGTMCPSHMP